MENPYYFKQNLQNRFGYGLDKAKGYGIGTTNPGFGNTIRDIISSLQVDAGCCFKQTGYLEPF